MEQIQLLSPLADSAFLPGGDTGVLLIHGFTGSPAHLLPLGRILNAHGYTVSIPRLPGHGTTLQDMAARKAPEWQATAEKAAEHLFSVCKRVVLCGLSMGGCIALILSARLPAAGCVTYSAPMAAANRFSFLAPVLAPVRPYIDKSTDTRAGRDPAYDIGYDSMPTAAIGELNKLIRAARAQLSRITCPILCVQSLRDTSIVQNSISIILQKTNSTRKESLLLPDAPHVCTISSELNRIAETTLGFLQKC